MYLLTEEKVGTTSVGEIFVIVVGHVGQCDDVELGLPAAPCSVDREEDRKADCTSHETYDDRYLEKSKKQVSIQALMRQE